MSKSAQQTTQDAAVEEASHKDTASNAAQSLSVALGPALAAAWRPKDGLIMERLSSLRDAHEKSLGVTLPAIKFVDGQQLGDNDYEIRLFGARYAGGEIEANKLLAIRGEQVRRPLAGAETVDPAFGLPATWIEEDKAELARGSGYTIVDPITVFMTHLGELARSEAPALLSRATVVRLLDEVRARQSGLVEELIPTLMTVSDVQKVLQGLLSESVSIAAIDLIVEHLVDLARTEKDTGALTELVRQRIGHTICNALRGRRRDLAVMSLDPRLENQIQANVAATGKKDAFALEPRLAEQLIRKIGAMAGEMMRDGREAVLLCGPDIRRPLRALTRRSIPKLSVLSISEIPLNIELRSHGIVKLEASTAPARGPNTLSGPLPGRGDHVLGTADVQLQ